MFSYLRSYYIITFLLVLVGAFLIGVYFRSVAANGLIRGAEEKNALILTTSYVNNIWNKHREMLTRLSDTDIKEWPNHEEFRDFYRESLGFFKDVPLEKYSIYSADRQLFFSINKNEVMYTGGWVEKLSPYYWMFFQDEDSVFERAMRGEAVNRILSPAKKLERKLRISSENGRPSVEEGSYIQILVPVFSEDDASKVEAVIEVYYDITVPWGYLYRFQWIGTFGILLFISILSMVWIYVSRRAERVIDKQHQANIELTAAKTRAEAESEEKSKFLANVSHELRTPLNAIIGFSQIIKDEVSGPLGNDQYKDYIRDIHTSGSHLLSLINDILDYSKAEANKLEVDEVDIDLNKTVKTSIRLVMPRAEEAQVTLVANVPKEHIILKADSKRMKQILLNLLSNAVKFTPEGGTVTLSTRIGDDGGLIIEVNDTGIGIAQKDISKAMATFGQVDSKLSRRFEGTGLGLPLTKKLVEIMKGSFEIQSELGLGTTVTLRFKKEKLSSLPTIG